MTWEKERKYIFLRNMSKYNDAVVDDFLNVAPFLMARNSNDEEISPANILLDKSYIVPRVRSLSRNYHLKILT